jgi:hypothetical protein
MKTIEITIGPKGDVQLETRGFAGASCRDASKALVASLGLPVAEQLTAEFYQSAHAAAHRLDAGSSSSTPRVP